MDKFLEIYNLPRLNNEDLENLNGAINSEKIETTIKSSKKVKVQDHMDSVVNSTKYSKIWYLSSNSSKKIEEDTS